MRIPIGTDSTVHVTIDGITAEGHPQVTYTITGPDFEYVGNDLSGPHHSVTWSEREALRALLSFLYASCEAMASHMHGRESENRDLFPPHVMAWAYEREAEIALADDYLNERQP